MSIIDLIFPIHLIAATSWIGGSVFMFILGVTIRSKEDQKKVYPIVGPIFGWFELGALIVLLSTGVILGIQFHLFPMIFQNMNIPVSDAVTKKVLIVTILTIVTVVHFVIAYRSNDRERSHMEQILSRSSSMLILVLNLFVMYYAILLRNIL